MNLQKIKLSIKKARLAVNIGFKIYKAVQVIQWLCENIPWQRKTRFGGFFNARNLGINMIDTNYVPRWHISPFQHVQYTLARNQIHMDLLFEDMNNVDTFLSVEGAAAQVDFYSNGAYAVVQLGDTSERKLIEVYGLLLHEAVHVWQKVRKLMGEKEPSSEFEAYSIQAIAQDLFKMYEESEVNDGMEGEKAD